jgi:hypothetical protein
MRGKLNQYNSELHTIVEPLQKTIFQVNGYLAELEDYPNIDYIQLGALSFKPEQLSRCLSALEELTRIVEESGYQQNNPWNGCVLNNLTYEFRQLFSVDSLKLLSLIDEGTAINKEISSLTGTVNISFAFGNVEDAEYLLSLAEKSPKVPFAWLSLDLLKQIGNTLACSDSLKKYKKLDEFCKNLKPRTDALLSAIQKVTDCTLNNERETRQDCNNGFMSMHDRFVSVLPMGEVSVKLSTFSKQFILCQELKDNYERTQIEIVQFRETADNFSKSFYDEQKIYDKINSEWDSVRKQLLSNFSEHVLSIDSESMLSRYRTDYRSGFTRFFSAQYRSDRKTLLGFCKNNVKMT